MDPTSKCAADIEDGDDNGIDISCADGEILTSNSGVWECSPFNTVIDADSDGVLTWNDCDDDDVNFGAQTEDNDCDGVLTNDDCDDNNASDAALSGDCDEDGYATAEDCDDTDSSAFTGSGTSSLCSGTSCKTILDVAPSSTSGEYWIQPEDTAFPVYCDMSTDGGGWTMVLMVKDNDVNTFKYNSSYWTSTTLLNESLVDPSTDENMKNQAYHSLAVTEMRLDLVSLGNLTISVSAD